MRVAGWSVSLRYKDKGGTESDEVNRFPFGQTHVGFAKYPETLKNSDFHARCARAFFTAFITWTILLPSDLNRFK